MTKIIGIDLEDLKEEIRVAVRNEIQTCMEESRFGLEFSDEVWDRKKVASFLQTTPENVSVAVKNKAIPAKMVGREYRFLKSQIVGMFKKGK